MQTNETKYEERIAKLGAAFAKYRRRLAVACGVAEAEADSVNLHERVSMERARSNDAAGCIERTCDILRAEDFKDDPVGGLEVVAAARIAAHDQFLAFVEQVARMQTEEESGPDGMSSEDAIATVNGLIATARALARGGK